MKTFHLLMLLFLSFSLAICSGGSKVQNPQFAFLDSLGIAINDGMLLGDTLALPDVYCGDPRQQDGDFTSQRKPHRCLSGTAPHPRQ